MYEAPVTIYETAIQTIMEEREGAIIAKIQSAFDVDVDKAELLRALQYDRDQYKKGYADGKASAVTHGMWHKYRDHFTDRHIGWICTNCSAMSYDLSNGDTTFCPHCGALMDLEEDDGEQT